MAEHKRHMDVPQERFSESSTQADAGGRAFVDCFTVQAIYRE